MSQSPTPGPTGHVEATPEAQPLDPASASSAGGTGQATGSSSDQAGSQSASQPSGGGQAAGQAPQDRAEEIGREVAERLKPVAAVAEEVAARALDLSAKGLGRLSAKLHERRQRASGGGDGSGGQGS